MSWTRSAIARDIEQQLIRQLQDDVNRRLNIAVGVIDYPEIAIILANIATAFVLGAETFVTTHLADGEDTDATLSRLESSIMDSVRANRDRVIRTATALRAGQQVDAAL